MTSSTFTPTTVPQRNFPAWAFSSAVPGSSARRQASNQLTSNGPRWYLPPYHGSFQGTMGCNLGGWNLTDYGNHGGENNNFGGGEDMLEIGGFRNVVSSEFVMSLIRRCDLLKSSAMNCWCRISSGFFQGQPRTKTKSSFAGPFQCTFLQTS